MNLFTFFQKPLKSSGIIMMLFVSLLTIFISNVPISFRIIAVAGSRLVGILYIPVMIAFAKDSSKRYHSFSPKSVFIVGALWAREKRTLHSRCIACSTSS